VIDWIKLAVFSGYAEKNAESQLSAPAARTKKALVANRFATRASVFHSAT
jgi:hypothetical protein